MLRLRNGLPRSRKPGPAAGKKLDFPGPALTVGESSDEEVVDILQQEINDLQGKTSGAL